MFGFEKALARQLSEARRNDQRYFIQYVGDDTLLLFCRDEFFLYVDARDASLTPTILRDGTWEPGIAAFLDRALAPGDCFIDIGANNGIHSLRAGRKVGPNGLVLAFEPQARLANMIQRASSANLMIDRLHVRRLAIGAQEGIARLGTFDHLTGSATLTFNSQLTGYEDVPLAPLPQALAQVAQEIGRSVEPDVIKIDAEGFEYVIWDGMKDWTRERMRLAMIVEFSPFSYINMDRDPRQLLTEFDNYGFTLAVLEENGTPRALDGADLDTMAAGRTQHDLLLTKGCEDLNSPAAPKRR